MILVVVVVVKVVVDGRKAVVCVLVAACLRLYGGGEAVQRNEAVRVRVHRCALLFLRHHWHPKTSTFRMSTVLYLYCILIIRHSTVFERCLPTRTDASHGQLKLSDRWQS